MLQGCIVKVPRAKPSFPARRRARLFAPGIFFAREITSGLHLAGAPDSFLACEAELGLERLNLPTLERAYTIIDINVIMARREPVRGRTPSVKCRGRRSMAQ